MKKIPSSVRSIAAQIVCAVAKQGRSLNDALELVNSLEAKDQSLCKQICYGTLRWYIRLEAILNLLVEKPFRAKDTDIKALALIGLYQLIYLDIPAHAAVSETVEGSQILRKKWARGILNAVLRRFLREQAQLEEQVDLQPQKKHAHPAWLVDNLQADWPDQYLAVLEQNNLQAPMAIRVNQQHNTREDYQQQLEQEGIPSTLSLHNPQGLILDHPVSVDALPNFWQGHSSVQDSAAQLAAPLLSTEGDQRILDVCAAPGGKTAHLLEQTPNIQLTALDIDPNRNKKVQENLSRLGLNANVISADATDPDKWFDGQQFDRILLDAPCSATGVIRRHPDIKLLRKKSDILPLVQLQQQILDAIWPLLAQNGILLYATCSILKAENSRQIESFLDRQKNAKEIVINAGWGTACKHGRQIFPGEQQMDGFYYACLMKK